MDYFLSAYHTGLYAYGVLPAEPDYAHHFRNWLDLHHGLCSPLSVEKIVLSACKRGESPMAKFDALLVEFYSFTIHREESLGDGTVVFGYRQNNSRDERSGAIFVDSIRGPTAAYYYLCVQVAPGRGWNDGRLFVSLEELHDFKHRILG
ncbi:MAG: hypothetical protein IAE64_04880 [Flavobacteriales bacterium]|nr:hypothetical protein [Flavobacteriales bacterium]